MDVNLNPRFMVHLDVLVEVCFVLATIRYILRVTEIPAKRARLPVVHPGTTNHKPQRRYADEYLGRAILPRPKKRPHLRDPEGVIVCYRALGQEIENKRVRS